MKSMDFGTPEEIKPIDDEWSLFKHKMVEDTGKVLELNKTTLNLIGSMKLIGLK